ncbi:MAG: mannonate dehydratase [Akkermansiaceae bacterium]|nr:mannonate dehydratase [Akkermansiaceae bacterium]
MHLGFGFYRHMLKPEYYRFAQQCGCTHAIVHLCDYGLSRKAKGDDQPIDEEEGWGVANHPGLWTLDELLKIKAELAEYGLEFYAIENFDPAQWHDVLLDGPKKEQQMEQLKEQIRIVGEAGVSVFGYNFSIAGVAARDKVKTRGGAPAVGMVKGNTLKDKPIPNGMVWNMVYDPDAPEGVLESISHGELWSRLEYFLRNILPVAEEAGVIMAAHPDDPPLESVRCQPRLVYQHALYQKLLDLVKSPSNQLEFCVGTLAEMEDGDLYACVERYANQNVLPYVHLRNVRGTVPEYVETFIDDGKIDVGLVLRILKENDFQGVVIPDHAPQMECSAPWHAGMAFALGYIKAKMEEA